MAINVCYLLCIYRRRKVNRNPHCYVKEQRRRHFPNTRTAVRAGIPYYRVACPPRRLAWRRSCFSTATPSLNVFSPVFRSSHRVRCKVQVRIWWKHLQGSTSTYEIMKFIKGQCRSLLAFIYHPCCALCATPMDTYVLIMNVPLYCQKISTISDVRRFA